jgi:O-antigen/teichoic acid export membrane protein
VKQTNDEKNQIKLGALISYISIAVYMLAGLLYTPWMVRTIGRESYGLYTLATSLISMLVLDFGLSAAVSRFISKYNAEKDQASVDNLLGLVYKLYLAIDGIICLALVIAYFFIGAIYKRLTPGEIQQFQVVYIIASSFSVLSFPFLTLNGILTSYEKFAYQKACDLFNKIAVVLLMVGALMHGFGLYALVTINAICGLATIAIKLLIVKKKTPVKVNFKYKNKTTLKEVLGFSAWITVGSIAQRFIFNIAPTVLGVVSGSVSIAVFGIASTVEGYVYTFATAINGMFLPRVSKIVTGKDKSERILELMIRIGRVQLYIIGLLVIGFVTVGKEFIALWIGNGYKAAYYCVVLLIIPSIFELPQQIAQTMVVAVNKVKQQAFVYSSMAIFNMVCIYFLSRLWNEIGAALSICLAYLVRTIAMNIIYHKELDINVLGFFKECHIKMIPALAISMGLGILVQSLIPTSGWSVFLAKAMLVTLLYATIMWLFALNNYEKSLAKSIVHIKG